MTRMEWDRRDFVRMGLVGGGAAMAGSLAAAAGKPEDAPKSPKMRYRVLGRTKLKVSEISFGSWGFRAPEILDAALDVGINFVSTSAAYQQGKAEESIGQILKKRRKDVYVITGWVIRQDTTKQQILEELDGSLKRLQASHVEIMRAHMVSDLSQIQNPALFEAFDEAKKAKKVSFLGLSAHEPELLGKILQYAADSGKFDVAIFRYDFMEGSELEKAIRAAAKKNMGLAVFKVDAGKQEKEDPLFAGQSADLDRARARWALKNPALASVIKAFSKFEDIKRALEIIEGGLSLKEAMLLEQYKRAFASRYCRRCGQCEGLCPHGVAVAEVMRYRMYYKYYGNERDAMELYAQLDGTAQAAPCRDCPGPCVSGCPYGVDVRPQLAEAHKLLTLTA